MGVPGNQYQCAMFDQQQLTPQLLTAKVVNSSKEYMQSGYRLDENGQLQLVWVDPSVSTLGNVLIDSNGKKAWLKYSTSKNPASVIVTSPDIPIYAVVCLGCKNKDGYGTSVTIGNTTHSNNIGAVDKKDMAGELENHCKNKVVRIEKATKITIHNDPRNNNDYILPSAGVFVLGPADALATSSTDVQYYKKLRIKAGSSVISLNQQFGYDTLFSLECGLNTIISQVQMKNPTQA